MAELRAAYRQSSRTDKSLTAECRRYGIRFGALTMEPNILYELPGFDLTRQLSVDEFHAWSENVGNIISHEFWLSLSPKARKELVLVWSDPETWEPLASEYHHQCS